MTKAFHDIYEMAKKANVNNRIGAYMVSVSRVAQAIKLRGWVQSHSINKLKEPYIFVGLFFYLSK